MRETMTQVAQNGLVYAQGYEGLHRAQTDIPDVAAEHGEYPTPPPVQALIPTWNDLLSLIVCLPSVATTVDQIIICDDGSDDGSHEFIEFVKTCGFRADIVLLHTSGRRGGTETRELLRTHERPDMARLWLDADDLLIPECWPRFAAELAGAGCLALGFHEVWGDHGHTTHWGFRADPCHIALAPEDRRLVKWAKREGKGFLVPVYDQGPSGVGPLAAFHLNGFKVDQRLAHKGAPMRRHNDHPDAPQNLSANTDGDIHQAAMRVLFENREHVAAPMPTELSAYLEGWIPRDLRFTMTDGNRHGDPDVCGTLERLRDAMFEPLRRLRQFGGTDDSGPSFF
ncbi:glycosyltransferase [Catenulispora sp. NL8]|uniref:Glycosyltransferase n=1 Tax=Catenulispora pinistramenti TaxID=2705254 RepID=A0ABS5L2E5_9ACTN|nr:glycosyltransferase [Catenulispora pinistramenti]MBS2552407.1 glycosyltransferase [Catenulispora pinistramenti]